MKERKWFDKTTPSVAADGAEYNKHERVCLDPGDPAPAGHEGKGYTQEVVDPVDPGDPASARPRKAKKQA
jgi:hypothetical protein